MLLPGTPAPYRESLQYAGRPVEMSVHTEATWHAYIERELPTRRSPLLWMCADGLLLFDTDGLGARLAAQARTLTAAGPPPASAEEIDARRYAITDTLDDPAGRDDPRERLFIATELVRRTGEPVQAVSGSWGGGGKWLAHRLETTLPGLSTRLHHGLREVLDGRSEPLVTVVDEVLRQVGGRLWVGYKRAGVS